MSSVALLTYPAHPNLLDFTRKKQKTNFRLCLIKLQAVKAHRGVEVLAEEFLTSALDGDKIRCFTEPSLYPLGNMSLVGRSRRLGGLHSRSRCS
jgi:hypothetical protein